MPTGQFISFYLPYRQNGAYIPPDSQAQAILTKAQTLVDKGAPGVAITYSANYGQTREIIKVYAAGGWYTGTDGANQAAVMCEMEQLMSSPYTALQHKMRIAPITTMNAYADPVTPWNETVLADIVTADLARIETYLQNGWCVLGWQNQDTVNNTGHPYAVGGGIAQLPPAVAVKIQATLMGYAKTYAG